MEGSGIRLVATHQLTWLSEEVGDILKGGNLFPKSPQRWLERTWS